jgi:hypothetical protein
MMRAMVMPTAEVSWSWNQKGGEINGIVLVEASWKANEAGTIAVATQVDTPWVHIQ